ncbi:hypothetical protein FB451DRAFT_1198577 [Mycena latifolia]|nr:hypothetical protein FB451DRAFT_1198577 [Mycena latifolia]
MPRLVAKAMRAAPARSASLASRVRGRGVRKDDTARSGSAARTSSLYASRIGKEGRAGERSHAFKSRASAFRGEVTTVIPRGHADPDERLGARRFLHRDGTMDRLDAAPENYAVRVAECFEWYWAINADKDVYPQEGTQRPVVSENLKFGTKGRERTTMRGSGEESRSSLPKRGAGVVVACMKSTLAKVESKGPSRPSRGQRKRKDEVPPLIGDQKSLFLGANKKREVVTTVLFWYNIKWRMLSVKYSELGSELDSKVPIRAPGMDIENI